MDLRQNGGGGWHGVDITQGQLLLEGCNISSQSSACIAIHGSATPTLRNNCIQDGRHAGIMIYEQGHGLIEENEIFGNADAGILIKGEGTLTVRNNRIHDGKSVGINRLVPN